MWTPGIVKKCWILKYVYRLGQRVGSPCCYQVKIEILLRLLLLRYSYSSQIKLLLALSSWLCIITIELNYITYPFVLLVMHYNNRTELYYIPSCTLGYALL